MVKASNEQQDPYLQMLDEWEDAAARLTVLKAKEMDLRLKLIAGAFPNPKEGTNKHKLPDGRELVGQVKVTRKIDEASLPVILAAMREKGVANTDRLVKYKPELAKSEWNTLSDEMKLIFSPAVIAVPGAPSFEVKPAPVTE